MDKIVPHLWYTDHAVEAAEFYAGIFPDSRLDRVTTLPVDTPSGPAGTVAVVEFTLCGQPFRAIGAGPLDPFNHAVSFVVSCRDQAEIDRYWDALLDGGTAEQCGWLRDRYGLVLADRAGGSRQDAGRPRSGAGAAGEQGDARHGEVRHRGSGGGLRRQAVSRLVTRPGSVLASLRPTGRARSA